MSENENKGSDRVAAQAPCSVSDVQKCIIQKLKEDKRRRVYISQDGEYWIDHQGGGPWHTEDIHGLVRKKILVRAHPDINNWFMLLQNTERTRAEGVE